MREKDTNEAGILEVRLFGGLHVSFGAKHIGKFESQKSRGIFVYLLLHRDRSFSRDFLAGMYWPEQNPHTARRNLRQAVYSLRRDFTRQTEDAWDPLKTDHGSIAFNSPPKVWVDVEAFQSSVRESGSANGTLDPGALAFAAQLYTGDFLAGFHVKNCPAFEDWMLQEQESLRESAAAALRRMVSFQLEEGGYALGIRYARQLIRLDPLAEDMYRKLMRLYTFSGRRERALAAYRELCQVLEDELGVGPQDETIADYEAIVEETLLGQAVVAKASPSGPLIPLVGREGMTKRLRRTWNQVQHEQSTMTVLTGAAGTGKTRLLRSFLHEASESRRTLVLRGHFHDHPFPSCLGGFTEALRNAVAHEMEIGESLIELAPSRVLADLTILIPELRELSSEIPPPSSRDRFEQLSQAIGAFLRILCRPQEDSHQPVPVILFLDDLQWADPASLQMISRIRPLLDGLPIWILAAYRSHGDELDEGVRDSLARLGGQKVEILDLKPLAASDIEVLAGELVVDADRERFSNWLAPWDGYPLPVTEQINLLWDLGYLSALPGGELRLAAEAQAPEPSTPRNLADLYRKRCSVLPTSCRRLLMLAAVCGHDFDAELLQEAEDEHEAVVETGLQLLLEHRLIRHLLGYWADSRRHRDIALWASGPRKGVFAFVHPSIRPALYNLLPEERRRILHGRIAKVLERRLEGGDSALRPLVASHYLAASQWAPAAEYLTAAVDSAVRLEAYSTAHRYLGRALQALEEASSKTERDPDAEAFESRIRTIQGELPEA